MNLIKHIPPTITNKVGRLGVQIAKRSPTILFGAGITCVIGSTVLACRATTKVGPALDEFKAEVDLVKNGEAELDGTPTDYRKDLTYVYAKNTIAITRLYAPAAIIGVVGIGCLTGSHIQLTRRNNALMAAYTALNAAYENYRTRVRDEVGVERELDLYHAAETKQILGGDGKNIDVKVADDQKWSAYARFFDESSIHWKDDPELNRLWVKTQQVYLNNLLRARGHVFLNEAYDYLGLERSSQGQIVGWVANGVGDNYIDFGMFKAYHQSMDAREPSFLLDFNVDGIVFDLI